MSAISKYKKDITNKHEASYIHHHSHPKYIPFSTPLYHTWQQERGNKWTGPMLLTGHYSQFGDLQHLPSPKAVLSQRPDIKGPTESSSFSLLKWLCLISKKCVCSSSFWPHVQGVWAIRVLARILYIVLNSQLSGEKTAGHCKTAKCVGKAPAQEIPLMLWFHWHGSCKQNAAFRASAGF